MSSNGRIGGHDAGVLTRLQLFCLKRGCNLIFAEVVALFSALKFVFEPRFVMIHSRSFIRGYMLVGFSEMVARFGADPVALVERVGLPAEALNDPDMPISFKKCSVLMDLAAQELGDPSFGLNWALNMQPDFLNTGPHTLLQFTTKTFHEWLDLGLRMLGFHTNGFTFRRLDALEDGNIVYRYLTDPFARSSRQQTEHIFATVCLIARKAMNRPNENPTLVRFRHPRPPDTRVHEEVFGCAVEFGCDHDEFLFSQAYLDLRTNGSLRLLQPLVSRFIGYRIERMERYTPLATTTVSLIISSVLGSGQCNLSFVAQSLGQNPKRLQRALADEGTSFSKLLDAVRYEMALRLLVESDASIEKIAGLLDYSSNAAFTLAFKRWTGETPLKYRKEHGAALAGQTLAGNALFSG